MLGVAPRVPGPSACTVAGMSEAADQHTRPRPVALGALVVAALALWVLAGAFYAGDIGKTRDDYTWAVNDPASGDVEVADMWRLPLFWRPLSLILVRHLVSLTWDAPWVANLLTAGSHLVLAALFWAWLRSLGFGLGAGAAGLVFLTLPMGYDVMHWPAAMPTALSGMLVIFAAMLAVRGASVARCVGIGTLAFVACCLNEQAAACMAAVAVLPLMLGGKSLGRRLVEVVTFALAIGVPCVLYVVLVAVTAPANHRGGASTLLPASDWPAKASVAIQGTWSQIFGPHGRDLTLGGFEVGLASLGVVGAGLLAVGVLAGLVWAWRAPPSDAAGQARRHGVLVLAGVAWFLLGLIPFVVVQTGPIEARHVYLPAIGALLAVLAALRLVGRAAPSSAAMLLGRALASIAVLASGAMAVSLVGIQTTLRERYAMDMAEAGAIVELFPEPAPGSVIVIARAAWREAKTGRQHYDMRFWSAWQMDHIATAVLRHEYGRDDIFAKHRFAIAFGARSSQFGDEGWTIDLSKGPAWDGGKIAPALVEWDRLLALRIDEDGSVVPIDRLVLKQQGQPDRTIELPQVRSRVGEAGRAFEVRLR